MESNPFTVSSQSYNAPTITVTRRRQQDMESNSFTVSSQSYNAPTITVTRRRQQDMESNPFTVSSQSYNAPDRNCDVQVSRGEVQERVIKNKTLLTSAEPAAQNLTLQRLLRTLRARVEADKLLLFHDTELRKMAAHTSRARLAAMAESSSPSAEAKSGSPSQVRTSVYCGGGGVGGWWVVVQRVVDCWVCFLRCRTVV